MTRTEFTFTNFNKTYNQNAGWYAVWAGFAEDHFGDEVPVLEIDMIYRHRITDGKFNFLAIHLSSEKELAEMKDWLKMQAVQEHKEIVDSFHKLDYPKGGE